MPITQGKSNKITLGLATGIGLKLAKNDYYKTGEKNAKTTNSSNFTRPHPPPPPVIFNKNRLPLPPPRAEKSKTIRNVHQVKIILSRLSFPAAGPVDPGTDFKAPGSLAQRFRHLLEGFSKGS